MHFTALASGLTTILVLVQLLLVVCRVTTVAVKVELQAVLVNTYHRIVGSGFERTEERFWD